MRAVLRATVAESIFPEERIVTLETHWGQVHCFVGAQMVTDAGVYVSVCGSSGDGSLVCSPCADGHDCYLRVPSRSLTLLTAAR